MSAVTITHEPSDELLPWHITVVWPEAWRADPAQAPSVYRHPTAVVAGHHADDILGFIENGG